MNHAKYLCLFYGVQVKFMIVIVSGMLTFNNMGLKFRNCLDGLLFVIFATFRTLLVVYVIFDCYP